MLRPKGPLSRENCKTKITLNQSQLCCCHCLFVLIEFVLECPCLPLSEGFVLCSIFQFFLKVFDSFFEIFAVHLFIAIHRQNVATCVDNFIITTLALKLNINIFTAFSTEVACIHDPFLCGHPVAELKVVRNNHNTSTPTFNCLCKCT